MMVNVDRLLNSLQRYLDYLSKLRESKNSGEKINWDKDYCDTLENNIRAELASQQRDIEEIRKLVMNLLAFVQRNDIKSTISRTEFYGSLNAIYNQANQIQASGEVSELLDKFKNDIITFEKFMEAKFPVDNGFFFFINENRGQLNKFLYTPKFMEFLDKCRKSNSGRKNLYQNLLQLIRALQFHASGNDENVLSNYNDLNEKQKQALRELANKGNNNINENVHKTIESIQNEIYNKIIYRFFKNKEKKRIREIEKTENKINSSDKITKRIVQLFRWEDNYTWKEVDQKIKETEKIIKEQKRAA